MLGSPVLGGGFAGLHLVGLELLHQASNAAGGSAPAWLNNNLPFLKAMIVGMDRI